MKYFINKCFSAPWHNFWSKPTARESHSRIVSSPDSQSISGKQGLEPRTSAHQNGVHCHWQMPEGPSVFLLSNSTATSPPPHCRTGKLLISFFFFFRTRATVSSSDSHKDKFLLGSWKSLVSCFEPLFADWHTQSTVQNEQLIWHSIYQFLFSHNCLSFSFKFHSETSETLLIIWAHINPTFTAQVSASVASQNILLPRTSVCFPHRQQISNEWTPH